MEGSPLADTEDSESPLDNALPSVRIARRGWTVLFSDLKDGEECIFFKPLMQNFGLKLNETINVVHFFNFMDFESNLVCIMSREKIFISRDSNLQLNDINESVNRELLSFDDISLIFPNKIQPYFWPAGESLNLIRPTDLIFDISEISQTWITLRESFGEGIDQLKGSPRWHELVTLLGYHDVEVEKKDLSALGVTFVEVDGTLVFPKIEIKASLSDKLASVVLAHEMGHLVLHLPILVAMAIEKKRGGPYFRPSVQELYSTYNTMEDEADWFGALLLIPPRLALYLETKGFPPAAAKKMRFFVGDREETFENRVWEAMRKSIVGQGEVSWPAKFEEIRMYSTSQRDEQGQIIHYDGDTINVMKMVGRFTEMVMHREERSHRNNYDQDDRRRELDDQAFNVIHKYLLLYQPSTDLILRPDPS